MNPWQQLLLVWSLAAVAQALAWRRQQRTRNAGIVDVVWSFGVGGAAVLTAATGQGAYVVAVIERKDSLTEKTANALTPSKAFTYSSARRMMSGSTTQKPSSLKTRTRARLDAMAQSNDGRSAEKASVASFNVRNSSAVMRAWASPWASASSLSCPARRISVSATLAWVR